MAKKRYYREFCQECGRGLRKSKTYGPRCREIVKARLAKQIKQAKVKMQKTALYTTLIAGIMKNAKSNIVLTILDDTLSLIRRNQLQVKSQFVLESLTSLEKSLICSESLNLVKNVVIPLVRIENPINNPNLITLSTIV